MATVKSFILEMLKALAGASAVGKGQKNADDLQTENDDVVSSVIDNNNKLFVKTNAYNENAALALDNIYNFLATNKNSNSRSTSPVQNVSSSSFIPNIDEFFDDNGYIPVKVLNPEIFEGLCGGGSIFDSILDIFDLWPDRKGKGKGKGKGRGRGGRGGRPPGTRTAPRTPPGAKPPGTRTAPRTPPGAKPPGTGTTPRNPPGAGRPSTGGPARYPRNVPGATPNTGFRKGPDGKIINNKTNLPADATEILDEIEKAGKWAKYSKLLKFLRAAGYVGVAMSLIDPIYAMYIGAPKEEVAKQLAGALGSIGGATLGAILGAAGVTAIPIVGQTGVANVLGGLLGGILGAFAGEWMIESLIEYLFDTSAPDTPMPARAAGIATPPIPSRAEPAVVPTETATPAGSPTENSNATVTPISPPVTPTANTANPASGTYIAGEMVSPDKPLTKLQMDAIEIGKSMGNAYTPEIERKYLDQLENIKNQIDRVDDFEVAPVSFAEDPSYYGEYETPSTGLNDTVEIRAENIHFVSDLIRFVYGVLLRNGMDSEGNRPSASGQPSQGAGGATVTDVAYRQPSLPSTGGGTSGGGGGYAPPGGAPGGAMPQEGPTSPTTPSTPEITGSPSEAKEYLSSISYNRDRPGDTTNLNDDFANRLASMLQAAPAEVKAGLGITSAYRSAQRQAEIIAENMGKYRFGASDIAAWNADVASMGPEAAGAKWRPKFRAAGLTANIGMPGGSKHQHGLAVDLAFNGAKLGNSTPPSVLNWIHSNAGRYGLHFPMGHEPWHIEPISARANQPETAVAAATTPAATPTASGGASGTEEGPATATGGAGASSAAPAGSGSTTPTPASGSSAGTMAAAPASGSGATLAEASVSTGKAISEKSTETFSNSRISNVTPGTSGTSQNVSFNPTNVNRPTETAGVANPLPALTAMDQALFENWV